MFSFNYSHTDYQKLVSELAQKMKGKVKANTLAIPEHIGNGYFKFIPLKNGLQCMLSDYTLNKDFYLQRNKLEKEFYVLRFDEISISETLMVKIDKDYIWEKKQDRASVFLTSSLYDFAYLASKGTSQKSINILITRRWLEQFLDIKSLDEVVQKYLDLKTDIYNFAPFDIEYRLLFNEIMESNDVALKQSVLENRIMMMVERFLTHLCQNLSKITEKQKISLLPDEIKRLMEVEACLVKDFSAPPPISFLSRIAAMSATTLKNKFKKLYGNNLYEYFQKSRMHRARVLLLSKKYSIKEIGSQLGYANLSNFAAAFKKEFDKLPSQLILQR